MRWCTISQDKAFKFLEWFFFIAFSLVAGWFSSGVLHNFFSQKTSFSQSEGEIKSYPVLNIVFFGYNASEVNLTNVMILYQTEGMQDSVALKIGENHLHNDWYNRNETVILEIFEDLRGRGVFRLISIGVMLNSDTEVTIEMFTKLEMKSSPFSDIVIVYLTSRENSPGIFDLTWKDGKPVRILLDKNTFVQYSIQAQMTKYLEELVKCQKEPYYECFASQLDAIQYEFNECSNKCIPDVFSIVDKNYSREFCQNDTQIPKCIFKHKQEIASHCKKSCSILEYTGQSELNIPYQSEKENWNVYAITYLSSNQDFILSVFEQYLINDAIEMIGSVGGTVGMFIKFCFLTYFLWH